MLVEYIEKSNDEGVGRAKERDKKRYRIKGDYMDFKKIEGRMKMQKQKPSWSVSIYGRMINNIVTN